ncbi:MAG: HD domain-containing protein [Planctomycetia bacterium]|nr:HD domain-containing protein [Planctomycetia bacterium]
MTTIENNKIIHCSVWGDIEISPLAKKIIDTPAFQRLHYIRQGGFAYKVFPSSNCSRFEHSIGVYHLVKLFVNTILQKQPEYAMTPRTIELLAIVGLIHDIGHGPFSHVFDRLLECNFQEMKKKNGKDEKKYESLLTHEERCIWLFRYMIVKYDIPLSFPEIEFITEKIKNPSHYRWYDTLIHNPYSSFDLDKIDYLTRDSLHFGLKRSIDISRILQNCRVIKIKEENRTVLCFCERIVDEIKFVFECRKQMYACIYKHPKIRFYEDLFIFLGQKEEIGFFWKDLLEFPEKFINMNDSIVLYHLWNIEEWKKAEIRKPIHSFYKEEKGQKNDDIDKQYTLASANTFFYSRKNLEHCFHLSFI